MATAGFLEAAALQLAALQLAALQLAALQLAALQLRALGFNRISFGIQDADPVVQRVANRLVPVKRELVVQDREVLERQQGRGRVRVNNEGR